MFKIICLLAVIWQTDSFRLPNNTEPVRYEIDLSIFRDPVNNHLWAIDGTVSVIIKIKRASKEITLHQRDLTLETAQLIKGEGKEPLHTWTQSDVQVDHEHEFFTFGVEADLSTQHEYTLTIKYSTKLTNEKLHDARAVLPCYDEPGLSAHHGISIRHDPELFVLSNTWQLPSRDISFKYTQKIPVHHLAVAFSDYKSIDMGGIQRLFFDPKNEGFTGFAREIGPKILIELESLLRLEYSQYSEKLDLIAGPFFSVGSRGSLGLTMYSETDLLYDPETDTLRNKQKVGLNIAHQYVNQYFGNLVSPAWWHFLWLSEGFAHFYSYQLLLDEFPEFEERYQIEMQRMMEHDAYGVTRAMTYYVESPEDVARLYDDISSSKSGSVLRMWMHALGESTWHKGLKNYLTEMMFKAVTSDDLAVALQKAADEDGVHFPFFQTMKNVVDSWSHTPGFPVVTVSTLSGMIVYTQSQFSYSFYDESKEFLLWDIPISITFAEESDFSNTEAHIWISHAGTGVQMPYWDDDWIIANVKQTGYYRVNYDDELWDKIINKLNDETFEDLHHASRAGLLNDAFNLARADKLPYCSAFRLTEYLTHEIHSTPWSSVSNDWMYLDRMLTGKPVHEWFNRYIQSLITELYDRYGALGVVETWSEMRLHKVGITWACKTDSSDCREKAKLLVSNALKSQEIVPDLQEVIYCEGLRHSDEDLFNAVWEKQQTESNVKFRTRMLKGLGCSENADHQKTLLDSILDQPYTSHQVETILNSVYSNSQAGLNNAIDFMMENFKVIPHLLIHASNMARLIPSVELSLKYSTLISLLEAEEVIEKEDETAFLTIININLKWLENKEEEILWCLKDEEEDEIKTPIVDAFPIIFWVTIISIIVFIVVVGIVVAIVLCKKVCGK